MYKFSLAGLGLSAVALIVLTGAGCEQIDLKAAADMAQTAKTVLDTTTTASTPMVEGWETYNDPAGKFSFGHPSGTYLSTGTKNGITSITLLSAPVSEGVVPDMTITIEAGSEVHFKTWENFDIPYFNQLVSSFRFK